MCATVSTQTFTWATSTDCLDSINFKIHFFYYPRVKHISLGGNVAVNKGYRGTYSRRI